MFKPDDVNKEFKVVKTESHCFELGQLVALTTFVSKTQALFTDLTGCITQLLNPTDVNKTKGVTPWDTQKSLTIWSITFLSSC